MNIFRLLTERRRVGQFAVVDGERGLRAVEGVSAGRDVPQVEGRASLVRGVVRVAVSRDGAVRSSVVVVVRRLLDVNRGVLCVESRHDEIRVCASGGEVRAP